MKHTVMYMAHFSVGLSLSVCVCVCVCVRARARACACVLVRTLARVIISYFTNHK